MRTPILAALTMTVAGTTLIAGGPAATAGATALTGPGWVTGVVLDGAGTPVSGALVNVLRSAEVPETGLVPDRTDRRTWTKADGSFRVRQGSGGYLVQVCRPDPEIRTNCRETTQGVDFVITYVGGSGTTDSWVLQQSLLPAGSGDRDLGEVTVKPKARVAGRLTGARAGEEVRLMRLNNTVAFRTWTDGAGRYALDGLVPGGYYIAAGQTGELPWTSAPVELTAGHTTRVDGALDQGAVIRGRLRSASGPVARAEVLVKRGGQFVAAAPTDAKGRFEVGGLVPGTYLAGIAEPGTTWQPGWTKIVVTKAHEVVSPVLRARRGASVSVDLSEGGRPAANATAELRNSRGVPVLVGASDERGTLAFTGLRPGRYTLVAAGRSAFGSRTVKVAGDVRLRRLDLSRPFLSVRGRTAPRAVVEATTGDLCPADGTHRYGAFHEIVVADARGAYRIDRLVPGRYMLGADGWPGDHAPRCWSGVRVTDDLRRDLPLERGASLTGRLVYAGTTLPVVTSLSYELFHRAGLTTNPTEEHPARGRSAGATGRFTIERVTPGSRVTGRLAREAGDGINDESFVVIYPFQDGTPYWLDTVTTSMTVPAGTSDLGDIAVATYGG